MKKIFLFLTVVLTTLTINAQTLEDIIKSYTAANKLDQVEKFQTIKISAYMSMPAMGMEMPMEMWMKRPNKIRTVTNISGQEMVQVFDGVKGYMVNPMTGSSAPVEMSFQDLQNIKRNNIFENYLANYLKEGKLTLEGDATVNGSAAFRIRAKVDESTSMDMFLDKSSYRLVKSTVNTTAQGMSISVDTYPSDYKEVNGFILPMKTTMSAQGMEFAIIFTKVEVDAPIDDSVFQVK